MQRLRLALRPEEMRLLVNQPSGHVFRVLRAPISENPLPAGSRVFLAERFARDYHHNNVTVFESDVDPMDRARYRFLRWRPNYQMPKEMARFYAKIVGMEQMPLSSVPLETWHEAGFEGDLETVHREWDRRHLPHHGHMVASRDPLLYVYTLALDIPASERIE